ncbi:MAG TPA: hypothetical protein VFE46_07605 [Pirellulales bacterium]|jgi:flagellar basal body-associated protein FliL|nr:hypothetical protein [Pirellulales bacterium]
MAEAPKEKTSADAPAKAPAAKPWWKSAKIGRWLVAIVVGSLVVHTVIFVILRKSAAKAPVQPEFTVGTFSVMAGDSGDRTVPGKFDLHVRFLDDLDAAARTRMTSHEFRVRESIEGLLRNAHGLEFDEPALGRLKHQIQESIDNAIDLRAVAEVMITDMTVPMLDQAPGVAPAVGPSAASAAVPSAAGRTAVLAAPAATSAPLHTAVPTAAPNASDGASIASPAETAAQSTVLSTGGGRSKNTLGY